MADLNVGKEAIVNTTQIYVDNGNFQKRQATESSSSPNKKTKLPEENEESKTSKEVISSDSTVEVTTVSNPADICSNKNTTTKKTEVRYCSNNKSILPRGMRVYELRKILLEDEIKFCQDVGLMPKSVKCTCKADMLLYKLNKRQKYKWTCQKNGHKVRISLRRGTWFEDSKQDISTILLIAYMWVHKYSLESMLHESDASLKMINEWLGSCIDLCQAILETKEYPIGGENKKVELFECKLKKEKWIFCAIELNSSNSLMLFLEDKSSDTVTQIFEKYFLPGTTVVSRIWCTYDSMTDNDFNFLTKEKSLTFYDLVTQIQMDTFSEFEKKTSRVRPKLEAKLEYDDEFFEKIYRKSLAFAPDVFIGFLKDVAIVKKPLCELIKTEKVEEE